MPGRTEAFIVPRPHPSLAGQLAVRLTMLLLVTTMLAGGAIGWRALVTIRSLDDAPLQTEANTVASGLIERNGSLQLHLPPGMEALFQRAGRGGAYIVADASGTSVLTSDHAAATELLGLLPTQPGLFGLPPMPGYPKGLIGFAAHSGPWRVFVVQGREHIEVLARALVADLLSIGLAITAGIGIVAILLAGWTVRQGLSAVRGASAAASRIAASRPGLRLPESTLPAEVVPMVGAVNQALDRLETALESQRRFMADAAHSLRTPLAVLIARLESLPDSPEKRGLLSDSERMSRLIGQMLQIARIEGHPMDVSVETDLREVAVEAISALAPLALQRGIDLELIDKAARSVRANRAALVIALQNLIENAIAYAPSGSTVQVRVDQPGRISVLDRGPGISEPERDAIFRRFHRGNASGPVAGGAGLGLAIVAEIATAHGGSARFAPRQGGGSVFALDLVRNVPGLATDDHGQDQVFTMHVAGNEHAADMHARQDDQQMPGHVMQVIHPRHTEEGICLG